jgi:methyl-galactoside transport system substrate-binding protein
MELFDHWAHRHGVPTFGYDGTPDAIAAVGAGLAGTVTQNSSVQAYLTLRLLRNALDGAERDKGIAQPDEQGNMLPVGCYRYDPDARSYYVANMAITEFNYQEHLKEVRALDAVSQKLDEQASPKRRVWLSIYRAADDFLDGTYQPLLALYDGSLNLDVDYIGGNGEDDDNVLARLAHPDEYDAFAINLVDTGNAQAYLGRLA